MKPLYIFFFIFLSCNLLNKKNLNKINNTKSSSYFNNNSVIDLCSQNIINSPEPTMEPTIWPTIQPTPWPTIPTLESSFPTTPSPTAIRRRLKKNSNAESHFSFSIHTKSNIETEIIKNLFITNINTTQLGVVNKIDLIDFFLTTKKIDHIDLTKIIVCHDFFNNTDFKQKALFSIINQDIPSFDCAKALFNTSFCDGFTFEKINYNSPIYIHGTLDNKDKAYISKIFINDCSIDSSISFSINNSKINKNLVLIENENFYLGFELENLLNSNIFSVSESSISSDAFFVAFGITPVPGLTSFQQINSITPTTLNFHKTKMNYKLKVIEKFANFLFVGLSKDNIAKLFYIPIDYLNLPIPFNISCIDISPLSDTLNISFNKIIYDTKKELYHFSGNTSNSDNFYLNIKLNFSEILSNKNNSLNIFQATKIKDDTENEFKGTDLTIDTFSNLAHSFSIHKSTSGEESIKIIPLDINNSKAPADECEFFTDEKIFLKYEIDQLTFEPFDVSMDELENRFENIKLNITRYDIIYDNNICEDITTTNKPYNIHNTIQNHYPDKHTTKASSNDNDSATYILSIILPIVIGAGILIFCFYCIKKIFFKDNRKYNEIGITNENIA